MSAEYDQYIATHKENVMKGLRWMDDNLPRSIINSEAMVLALENGELHDNSKFDREEYLAYDDYFYGGERTPEIQAAFDLAWLRHIHHNPHHWQYWVLMEDDPESGTFGKVLDMPLECIYEMIADWWTFSWKNSNLMEIFGWYTAHRETIKMSAKTRLITETILKTMFDILKMQSILEGKSETLIMEEFVTGEDALHSGIKGQKWGVRRFQNLDGTLTPEGKLRYAKKNSVFVSGSSKTQDESSQFYRAKLPKGVRKELDRHMQNEDRILVGDAPGIDRQVQEYLNDAGYEDVEVYGPGKAVRYSANEKWKTHPIDAPEFEEGSKEWLAKKDKAMSDAANEGLAIVIKNGAKATRKNVERLLDDNKSVKLFELGPDGIDKWIDDDLIRKYLDTVALELGEVTLEELQQKGRS